MERCRECLRRILEESDWITKYIKLENVRARCCICNMKYRIFGTITHFREHIINEHNEAHNQIIYENQLRREEGCDWIWTIFYITKNANVKCSICGIIYPVPRLALQQIEYHLFEAHYVNRYINEFPYLNARM